MPAASPQPRRRRALCIVAIAVAALSLCLAACGGTSDEDAVKKAVALNFLTANPDRCDSLYTDAFLEQQFDASGQGVLAACKELAASIQPSTSVDVTDVEIDDDSAAATATPSGGTLNGGVYDVGLVKDGDDWKYDSFDTVTPAKPDAKPPAK
ncbi:MAG: hypothetical protein EXQ70_00755 [Solirubrobacterales bacterium]|nr:hypothetical protein [Solirubrobacterales bacterium]